MKKAWAIGAIVAAAWASLWSASSAWGAEDRVGLLEPCSQPVGWVEWDDAGKPIPPRVKLEAKDGTLSITTRLVALSEKGTILRKTYGEVDLDKYHFLVVNVVSKGCNAYFGVNGFDTKCGYTTGVTAVDLKDYDDKRIHGKQSVRLEIDLHDNSTKLVLKEIKLVSQLTPDERKGLIGRGLTIRHEDLKAQDFHGLAELKRREKTPLPSPDGEEMAIFRDTATGAISTRLTCGTGDNYLGEGGIWSGDGAAITFPANGRRLGGAPVLTLGDGKLVGAPAANWAQWSPVEPTKLYVVSVKDKGKDQGKDFNVAAWDRLKGDTTPIATFNTPSTGDYVEVKRFTTSGKLIIAFRKTPHLFIVDPAQKKATHIELSCELKDASMSPDEQFILWAKCYTYTSYWRNLKTGEEGLCSHYVGGHSCSGRSGTVGAFGENLKIFVPPDVFNTVTAGAKIRPWANWQNDVITDYGALTDDNEYIFTNGMAGDVDKQHVMVASKDTGAVLRLARYFTRFSWTSPTYSRPSPDYTKLVYCDNCVGPAQLIMVYTRRTDPPEGVKLEGNKLSWTAPKRSREIAGYNVYASKTSGRDYVKVNDKLITAKTYDVSDPQQFYAVTSVEHSLLESMFSLEVSAGKARTLYFEAERLDMTPPARRFFDGQCNDFQCVRANPESADEEKANGAVTLDLTSAPEGTYRLWARTRGTGTIAWSSPEYQDVDVDLRSAGGDPNAFNWLPLGQVPRARLTLKLSGSGASLDSVLATTEDFKPAGADPRDATPPAAVKNLKAELVPGKGEVKLTWDNCADADFHHYSIYCGAGKDFKCDNSTLIRSVFKNSITDAGMAPGKVTYKVVAYDSRWNASAPAVVEVDTAERARQ
ncbi:MAG: hypothetical protein ACE15C_05605 [Phycisphaerae bacterium]